MLKEAASELFRCSKQSLTKLNLYSLYTYNLTKTLDISVERSKFLRNELPIRLSHMVIALEQLNPKLSRNTYISGVQGLYLDSFEKIINCRVPTDKTSVDELTTTIKSIKDQHNHVAETMAMGIKEFKSQNPKYNFDFYAPINDFLNRFYKSRISIRTLIEHHVSLEETGNGVIDNKCNVKNVIKAATDECSYIITSHSGNDVKVNINCNSDLTFTYIPSHLYYVLIEILKNAAKATVDKYGDKSDEHPITISVFEGEKDIIIKILDKGDSFPITTLRDVESYLYTTADSPEQYDNRPVLAGFGYGIPMAKLYCELFGGSLKILPIEGVGTDVTIYMHKLGLITESLD